jgi:ubiquinone/menaquinone biosynthesis C-methylase UbiE
MSTFTGTAPYYRRYRPGIPPEAAELLAGQVSQLAPPRRLLDLGSGTGQVPAALWEAFTEIDAVEPDADMLAQAETALRPLAADSTALRLHHQRAEAFLPPYAGWKADLVTICRAFHWMDQPAVLKALDGHVAPAGVVAVMGDGSLWTARTVWTDALRALIQEFLGEQRRAGSDTTYTHHDKPYAQVLAESAFSHVEETYIPVRRIWTPEQVIGYLYSTSFAARPLFGDRIEEFEAAATALLTMHAATGPLVEDAGFQVVLARRPS